MLYCSSFTWFLLAFEWVETSIKNSLLVKTVKPQVLTCETASFDVKLNLNFTCQKLNCYASVTTVLSSLPQFATKSSRSRYTQYSCRTTLHYVIQNDGARDLSLGPAQRPDWPSAECTCGAARPGRTQVLYNTHY